MVALELSSSLRVGYAGLLDASLVGLLLSNSAQIVESRLQTSEEGLNQRLGQGLLLDLEQGDFDCAVVPFEDFAFYACSRKTTELRILGCLLGGDTRVIAEVGLARSSTETRHLGAASPGCALMRFDDLSCANNLEFPCVSSFVPHDNMFDAVQLQKYDFLEVNSYWEALAGLRLGMIRQTFKMQDYGVPSSRSHLLVINAASRSISQRSINRLRSEILEAYEIVLTAADNVQQEVISKLRATLFAHSPPNRHSLAASLRILNPHIEEAHTSRLRFDWRELQSFYRWFHRKMGHSPELWGAVSPGALEHLICDSWA